MSKTCRRTLFPRRGSVRACSAALLSTTVSLLTLSCGARADTCTLAAAGKPQAVIVIPDNALPVDRLAAQELQYHVERATGVSLPISGESQKPARAGSTVYIGSCRETARRGIRTAGLAANGSVTRTVGVDLFIAGDDGDGPPLQDQVRAGSLFGVYNLLETKLGVRWLWPGKLGEVIPQRADIALSDLDETHAPPLIHSRLRITSATLGPPDAWADPADRGHFINDEVVWMRRHQFSRAISLDIHHAFSGYWARFGADHPDYFNLLPDGTRRPDPLYERGEPSFVSMNLSNPALWRQIVADWRAHRTAFEPNVDASENDTFGKDMSPATLAWDVPDPALKFPWEQRTERAKAAYARKDPLWPMELGSLSDRYAQFWLEVQRDARKEDPNAVVMGFAYDNYVEPPIQTKLNTGILVAIVPPLVVPYTDAMRAQFRRAWAGWSGAGARLMFRPNLFLDGHDLPVNYARRFAEDFNYAYAHGLYATDFDSLTGQWAAQGPNLYVLGRLNDHPDWSADRILAEYYGAFGPAAAAVRAYFTHWERATSSSTEPSSDPMRFYRVAPAMFTPAVMAEGRKLLDDALAAAGSDDVAHRRVEFLDLGFRHAELTLAAESAARTDRPAGLRNALTALDAFRAQHEKQNIADMGFLALAENGGWNRSGVSHPALDAAGRLVQAGPHLISNGGFELGLSGWSTQTMTGTIRYAFDSATGHSGKSSGRMECSATGGDVSGHTAWGRLYRLNVPVEVGASYRLSAWVKTSSDFKGSVLVWFDANGGSEGRSGPTAGEWRHVVLENVAPRVDRAGIYINLVDGTGTVWVDDVELVRLGPAGGTK